MNRVHLFSFRHNQGRWTEEESMRFDEAYAMYGKNWKMITRAVGTRSIVQVRSHAQKVLPSLTSRCPPPVDSSETQSSSNFPPNSSQQSTERDPETILSDKRIPICSIPPILRRAWAYHTLKAAECFQIIHSQNRSGESISRLKEDTREQAKEEENQIVGNLPI